MLKVNKIVKQYLTTSVVDKKIKETIKPLKFNCNILIGTTESHANPIKLGELKPSIFNKPANFKSKLKN